MTTSRVEGDVSDLPTCAFGMNSVIGWGTLGFMLIEGTAFVLAAGAYIYLQTQSHPWPPRSDRPPDLLWGLLFTALLVLSEIPNRWLFARAKACDLRGARWGLVIMSVLGFALLGLRTFELMHLNVRWSDDAYASVVWLLIVLHTSHVLTDLGDTAGDRPVAVHPRSRGQAVQRHLRQRLLLGLRDRDLVADLRADLLGAAHMVNANALRAWTAAAIPPVATALLQQTWGQLVRQACSAHTLAGRRWRSLALRSCPWRR